MINLINQINTFFYFLDSLSNIVPFSQQTLSRTSLQDKRKKYKKGNTTALFVVGNEKKYSLNMVVKM